MKSYEEMTEMVLLRARAQKAAQKRRRSKALIATACACGIALAVFAAAKINQPADGEKNRTSRISLFCVTANAAAQRQPMLKGERVPYHAVIHVRDIRGFDAWELLEQRQADLEYAEYMPGQDQDRLPGGPDWCASSIITDETMITTIFVGSFYMEVDDYNQIKDVSTTTTEIGWTAEHLTNYYDASLKDGIGITWSLSGFGLDMIEKNPEMKLSELKDTITVTVEFVDGSKETAVIDITVDDDGQIYGTFVGSNIEG